MVFEYPGDTTRYIARVVGLPGETIEIRGRLVYINGTELPEQKALVMSDDVFGDSDHLEEISTEGFGAYKVFYAQPDEQSQQLDDVPGSFAITTPFRIEEGEYFLLGDNRDNSEDSRFRGAVPRELIWGTASVVYWSSFRHPISQEEQVRSERLLSRVR